MLSPARVLSLTAALTALLLTSNAADAAASTRRDVATYYIPETDRAEHKPVTAQLQALGITTFAPQLPPGEENNAAHLWSLVALRHADIDLVWSADAATPPFEKLSFAPSFHTKINHVPGTSERLTDADAFYRHIRENQRKKESFFFNFVPKHFVLPRDQAEMPKVFAEAAKRVENEMKREDDAFIYQRFLVREKPVNGNDDALTPGAVVTDNDELLATINAHHQGKDVEVTQYIEPYLIDGHKFQVGFYVAITSVDPLRIYYYGHPEIMIAKTAYPTRLKKQTDQTAYNFNEFIAPWDFPDLQHLYYELPSVARPGTNSWTVLKRYMLQHGLDTTRLQKEIDAAIVTSIISSRGFLQSKIHKLQRTTATPGDETTNTEPTELDESFFELLRFDLELDDMGKPWLTRIHSNPSMVPHTTVFGTDEAIKNNLLFDLFNLIGVHPQAKPSFDEAFVPADAAYCAAKCLDGESRVWDSTCWSCPGGFAPYVARRLFNAKHEYARRGGFKLVFPSLDQDYTRFLDNQLSEHDTALNRYVKSLSAAYADRQQDAAPVLNSVLTCAFREHCSSHGDCVNGQCVCDEAYEGATCYIPKDMEREARLQDERVAADARARESWMGKLWNRAPVPAPLAAGITTGGGTDTGAKDLDAAAAPHKDQGQAQQVPQGASSGGVFFGVLFVGIFAYAGYQVYESHYGAGAPVKSS